MKKTSVLFCLVCILVISAASPGVPPEVKITNGLVSARIYLPQKDNGYYRGSRFDWSGIIAELQWSGHSYFGEWFEKYNPSNHDAVLGPAEVFDPVGFERAKPGETFVKIGVGALVKPNDSAYNFIKPYTIANYGKWQVQTKTGQVRFLHLLKDKSFAYEYAKTVKLSKGLPRLLLIHSLKNTGRERIETKVYDHNFFVMDHQLTGEGYVITFPFRFTPLESSPVVEYDGNDLRFVRELGRKNFSLRDMTRGREARYEFRIENYKTGAGVKITCDRPVSKLDFWSASKTVCPEPYIDIRLDPGQEFTWQITYDFYLVDSGKITEMGTLKK